MFEITKSYFDDSMEMWHEFHDREFVKLEKGVVIYSEFANGGTQSIFDILNDMEEYYADDFGFTWDAHDCFPYKGHNIYAVTILDNEDSNHPFVKYVVNNYV